MDTSKEYIEMCEKAKPFWTKEFLMDLDHNTFWAQKHNGEWVIDIRGCIPKKDIPLLRQDQLQEMISFRGHTCLYNNVDTDAKFDNWMIGEWDNEGAFYSDTASWTSNGWVGDDTAEKALLKGVMKEKFGKTWDGEDWRSNGIS